MESILTYFKELATIETAQLTEQLQFLKDFWKKSSNRQHNPDIKEPTIEEIEEGLTLLKGMCKGSDDTESKEEMTYKDRYYKQRWTDSAMDAPENREQLCKDYFTGLQWVLDYYYQGLLSWNWFYPHHYAPLVSDMLSVDQSFTFDFKLGEPCLPLENLLAVLPVASGSLLPKCFQRLITDPKSPIADLYPTSFQIDMDFATILWEGIALLPFVDQKRIREAIALIDLSTELTDEEQQRNEFQCTQVFEYNYNFSEKKQAETKSCVRDEVVSVRPFVDPPIKTNDGKFLPLPCEKSTILVQGYPQFYILNFYSEPKKVSILLQS
ncbi:hypothetical protein RFI_17711, partial [Reticulomyxa filosa]